MNIRLLSLALGCALALVGQPARKPLKLESPVADKNFYLLTLLQDSAAVEKNEALQRITEERARMLNVAVKNCALEIACYADAFRWSEEQIGEVAEVLKIHTGLLEEPLRASGMYVRAASLGAAWRQCAEGLNRVIDVYGLGKPPRYAEIDAMLYDPKSPAFPRVVQNLALMLQEDKMRQRTFFGASEAFALELLELNQRDEAGRFEPMELGENALAYAVAQLVPWDKYEYSVIVVPGAGNDRPGVRLSAAGKLRDEIAAKRWKEGRAPFLLVSGGFVHPARTEYAEAVEMKHDLMTRLKIPESAILIDPHARHTTTNMRNAARLMYRYGMPFAKKALVTTDAGQSAYIEGDVFRKRCMDELGYVPYELLGRTSVFDLEFRPRLESLQSDALSPLDP